MEKRDGVKEALEAMDWRDRVLEAARRLEDIYDARNRIAAICQQETIAEEVGLSYEVVGAMAQALAARRYELKFGTRLPTARQRAIERMERMLDETPEG